jgi:hypothetical protein
MWLILDITMWMGAQIMDFSRARSFQLGKMSELFKLMFAARLTRSSCRDWVTEYGGMLISPSTARQLPPAMQTWLRTLSSQFWEIDGNPIHFNGYIDMAQRHVLGSLINHSFKRQNCSFECEDWDSSDVLSGDGLRFSKCIFMRATRDIYPNEQLLASYGATAYCFPNLPL